MFFCSLGCDKPRFQGLVVTKILMTNCFELVWFIMELTFGFSFKKIFKQIYWKYTSRQMMRDTTRAFLLQYIIVDLVWENLTNYKSWLQLCTNEIAAVHKKVTLLALLVGIAPCLKKLWTASRTNNLKGIYKHSKQVLLWIISQVNQIFVFWLTLLTDTQT